jgi:hypothetical protein
MRRHNTITVALVIAILSMTAAASGAEKMGISRGHDLDALWAQAQNVFDTGKHDAILLLESRHETIDDAGGRKTIVHRVVWIATPPGLRDHADLRIPWNTMNSTMTVHLLRTWREGRWWPHESTVSPTAVVETLPYAVATADDYTTMRETMLLHDGVELPCIMETAYEIYEDPGAPGHDGLFVMQQRDPATLVELKVTVPEGPHFNITGGNGAPVPETAGGAGAAEHIVTMENLDRLGSPRVADPTTYAPFVTWSTWPGWGAIRNAVMESFDEAAVLSPELKELVAGPLGLAPSKPARARKAAQLVDKYTRSIHYDSRFWRFHPRNASRTYETAYGHALDRAVLAAALFREAGLKAEPVFVSGPGGADPAIACLSRFGEIKICVHKADFRAIYDPAEGILSTGPGVLYGLSAWKPASDEAPWSYPSEDALDSSYDLFFTLEPGKEGKWKGAGYIFADGIFSPYADMTGLGGEMKAALNTIAGSVIPGSEVTVFNPETFEKTKVTSGFEFTLVKAEPDSHGRSGITFGAPHGGIMDILPGDVHQYHENRTSPVVIPTGMNQTVTVRIKACKESIAHLPEARTLDNEAGSFSISVEMKDGWVTIRRSLSLEGGKVTPDMWPQLRALLLEAQDPAGRKMLVK